MKKRKVKQKKFNLYFVLTIFVIVIIKEIIKNLNYPKFVLEAIAIVIITSLMAFNYYLQRIKEEEKKLEKSKEEENNAK